MENLSNDIQENQQLVSLLADLIPILHANHLDYWAARFADARERCDKFDPSGLVIIVESYGGMGSINDLNISPEMHALVGQIGLLANQLLQKIDARERASK